MKLVIPTIFAKNKKQFDERFKKLLPVSRDLQIDFMDGKFVRSKSVQIKDIPNLKNYKNNFEAHIMVSDPERWISKLKQKGFKKIIFHIETTHRPERLIQEIKKLKIRPVVAINPKTSLDKLPNGVPVLFMGVIPGKEKQAFVPLVYEKIRSFRQENKRTVIQVDGGASPKNIKKLARLGVDAVNSGSYISNSDNPKQALNKLKSLFKE